MLGISYTELLILIGAGIVLIGPKDLPRVARTAGRATGKAVSQLSTLRRRALSFAEESDISKLHEELQASLRQLRSIQSELRTGVNIFDPGYAPAFAVHANRFTSVLKCFNMYRPVARKLLQGSRDRVGVQVREQQRENGDRQEGGAAGDVTMMDSLLMEDVDFSSRTISQMQIQIPKDQKAVQ